jgi:hypothetical protein
MVDKKQVLKEATGKKNITYRQRVTTDFRWFMPVILAAQETEIRRITIQSQPRQTVSETLSQKNTSHTQKKL